MRHLKRISIRRPMSPAPGFDPAGVAFFQLWLLLATWIIGEISDTKD